MDNKELANVFYNLAVDWQQGNNIASDEALVHVQRAIEQYLPKDQQQKFRSDCGLIYWGD